MGLLNDLFYICAPTPLQHGVIAGIGMGESYLREMRDSYAEKRALLCETLQRCGFDTEPPQGAYYACVNFERLSGTRHGFADSREASQTIMREAGVGSVAGASFYSNPEDGRYFLRFCFAKELAELREACDRMLSAFGS
jgi:aminotransferase